MYRCTSKNLDDHNLTADLTSDLSLAIQWVGELIVSFSTSKGKLVMFHHLPAELGLLLIIMNSSSLKEAPYLGQLLGLTPDLV